MNLINAALRSDDPVTVRLAKNAPTLSPATVLADFEEADFSGYSPQEAVPLSEPVENVDGKVSTQSLVLTFEHNGGPTSNTVSVYYVTLETDAGSQLLWADTVEDAPKAMGSVGDAIEFSVEIRSTQEV